MDDFSYQGRFRDLRSLMVRNGRGLSKIAGSLAHNTYRVGIEAERQRNIAIETQLGPFVKAKQMLAEDEKIVGLSALIGNGMGVMFVTMAQRMALREGAAQRTKDTWDILDKWLGLDGKEFGPELHSKVNKAYDAYLAIGIAPSTKLQPKFDEASQDLKSEAYNLRPHKPPPEVIRAFDRMLATDEAIKAKREADRPDNPKPDSSWPKPPDDPLTKSVQRLSARVTSLELEAAKKPKPKYVPPEESSKGLNNAPWILTGYDDYGYNEMLFSWLMGVVVSFIVAWVFVKKRD